MQKNPPDFRRKGAKCEVLEIIDSSMTAEAAAILDRQRYLPKSARTFLDVLQTVAARAAGGQHEER